jgi:hypothetical protein
MEETFLRDGRPDIACQRSGAMMMVMLAEMLARNHAEMG